MYDESWGAYPEDSDDTEDICDLYDDDYMDYIADLWYERGLQFLEQETFENQRLHGKQAHAYKHEYDNVKIMLLREDGKTYREIAKIIGCSPSTVRNRLRKLGRR